MGGFFVWLDWACVISWGLPAPAPWPLLAANWQPYNKFSRDYFFQISGTVKLMLHVNGSYRARWDDPLGFCMYFSTRLNIYFTLFCLSIFKLIDSLDDIVHISGKHVGPPLAFKCIKASGGRVPRTLVGVARIYPVLYKERYTTRCKLKTLPYLFHWSILNCIIQVVWWSFCCEIWKDGKESATTVPPEVHIYVTETVGNIIQLNTLYVHHTLNGSILSLKWTMFSREESPLPVLEFFGKFTSRPKNYF
jgi:hypothetical protein